MRTMMPYQRATKITLPANNKKKKQKKENKRICESAMKMLVAFFVSLKRKNIYFEKNYIYLYIKEQ